MAVKLKERVNGDGTTTFYLDIFFNKKRWTEFLTSIKLTNKPSNPAERQANKENRATAKRIALERAREIQSKDYSVESENSKLIIVIDWMKEYAEKYRKDDFRKIDGVLKNFKKADFKVIDGVVKRFETFLAENKKVGLLMKDLDSVLVKEFKEELEKTCVGEGAKSYYNRFKKIMRNAVEKGKLSKNPCIGVDAPEGKAREKDTLTSEEIQLLAATKTEALEIKRAALFSTQTGIRWCDQKVLTWEAVDLQKRTLKFKQSKTDNITNGSLNQTAISLLGPSGEKDQLIFDLPTANGANKTLKAWVKRAGINKKIRWHNLRHSFGTNLYESGAEIYTVSKLLGHTSITHTTRYARASDKRKQEAVDNLPEIDFNSRIVENYDTFSLISTPRKEKKPVKKKNKSAK